VGLVGEQDYAEQVENTTLFLQGKSRELLVRLADDMEQAAQALDYERAAVLRDQISTLQQVQSTQGVEGTQGDLDVVAVALDGGQCCVQVLFVRDARILGSKSYYPSPQLEEGPEALLGRFCRSFTCAKGSISPARSCSAMRRRTRRRWRRCSARPRAARTPARRVRDVRARWLQLARQTADTNLQARLSGRQSAEQRLQALREALALPGEPQRIECFRYQPQQRRGHGGLLRGVRCRRGAQVGLPPLQYRRCEGRR
jgi:excinuclease ABC subunit C